MVDATIVSTWSLEIDDCNGLLCSTYGNLISASLVDVSIAFQEQPSFFELGHLQCPHKTRYSVHLASAQNLVLRFLAVGLTDSCRGLCEQVLKSVFGSRFASYGAAVGVYIPVLFKLFKTSGTYA